MQLHPEPGGAEAALVALELRPQGPALGVDGFKAVRSGQGGFSWHLQLPSQVNVHAQFPATVKGGPVETRGV